MRTGRSPCIPGGEDASPFTPGSDPLSQLFLRNSTLNANVGFYPEGIISLAFVRNHLALSPLFVITGF